MTGPKRTKIQRERDLLRTADLYCQGLSQYAIAEQIGVSRNQITYDIRTLQKRWQESALGKFHEHLAKELARIDHVERIAWEAWERSCQPAETTSTQLIEGRTTKDGESSPDLRKSAKVAKSQAGDPRFLERVAQCIEQRCRLFGLYAPTKLAPTDPRGEEDHGKLTDDEAATGLANLLAILEARQLGPYAQPNGNGHHPHS